MTFLRNRLPILSIAFFLIGLLGCNVQEATPSILATDGVNLDLVHEIEQIDDPRVQKIVFTDMLSAAEKVFVFKKRVLGKMQELPLTIEQKDHLNLLLANVNAETYNPSMRREEASNFLSEWTRKGKEIFDPAVLKDIVASLSPTKKGDTATMVKTPPSSSSCDCATGSSWCAEDFYCTFISGCGGQGCGTFWLSVCNGHCDYRSPVNF
ncbi:bacteriocin fulvocin C-related protein [Fibrella aquatica]|jgi:hypothetical protein|uniref:bacteriocin fulvocin C-related protein n=1 Tax=Fibrella aquatica TaxID=3242487 RepID=UPI0035213196